MDTRHYTIIGDPPEADRYFRVASGGIYSRWDPKAGWVRVSDKAGRDYLSRAIETGDGVVPSTRSDIQRTTGK